MVLVLYNSESWPHRLVRFRTGASQASDTGSNPVGAVIKVQPTTPH